MLDEMVLLSTTAVHRHEPLGEIENGGATTLGWAWRAAATLSRLSAALTPPEATRQTNHALSKKDGLGPAIEHVGQATV